MARNLGFFVNWTIWGLAGELQRINLDPEEISDPQVYPPCFYSLCQVYGTICKYLQKQSVDLLH